jgi:hypothetical protein
MLSWLTQTGSAFAVVLLPYPQSYSFSPGNASKELFSSPLQWLCRSLLQLFTSYGRVVDTRPAGGGLSVPREYKLVKLSLDTAEVLPWRLRLSTARMRLSTRPCASPFCPICNCRVDSSRKLSDESAAGGAACVSRDGNAFVLYGDVSR